MIRSTIRRAIGRPARSGLVPYDMFDIERTQREVAAARKLERIYHKGQDKIWDGKDVLQSLLDKHGHPDLPAEKRDAIANLFAIILWGELAAWKVSAELALHLEPLEAKMAATSQAHDEARHFYVMHDYLELLGYRPGPLPGTAAEVLERILSAPTLAMKLVGMQLMVEPIALTIFHLVRESGIEPVLCDLLRLYERDEARHVALGVNYLPTLLDDMSLREAIKYWAWQSRMFWVQAKGLDETKDDFEALGFSPREVFRLGQSKQLLAAQMLIDSCGYDLPILHLFRAGFDFLVVYKFPEKGEATDPVSRLRAGWRAATEHETELAPSLVVEAAPA